MSLDRIEIYSLRWKRKHKHTFIQQSRAIRYWNLNIFSLSSSLHITTHSRSRLTVRACIFVSSIALILMLEQCDIQSIYSSRNITNELWISFFFVILFVKKICFSFFSFCYRFTRRLRTNAIFYWSAFTPFENNRKNKRNCYIICFLM